MTRTVPTLPPHERPRERLFAKGVAALSDRELLALMLRNGTRGRSALDLAHDLLTEHGGLAALARVRPEELARTSGVGHAKAAAIVAAFQLAARSQLDRESLPLRSAADVAAVAATELAGLSRERVLVLVCDVGNRLRRTVVVSEGAADRSLIPTREVLNAVLRHDGRAFALAHNHPSGDPTPSDADREATKAVQEAARVVGLRFLDHIVVAGERWERVTRSRETPR